MRRAILLLVGLAVVGAIPTLPTTSEPDIQQLILSAKAEDNNIDGEGKVQPDEEVESSLQDLASAALPDQDQVSTVGEEQGSTAEQPQAEAEPDPGAEKVSETQPEVEQTEPKVEQVNDDPEPQIEQISVDSEPQVEPQPDVGLFPLEPFEGNPLLKGDPGFVTVGHDTKFELPMVDKAEQEMGGFTEDYVGVDSPIVRGTLEEMAQDIFRLFVPSFNSNGSPSTGEVVTEDLPHEYIYPNTELIQPVEETHTYEFSPEMSANVEGQDETGEYFSNTPSDLIPVEEDTLPVDEDVIVMVEEENPIDETQAPLAPNNDYPLVTDFSYEPIFREEVSLANFFIPSFERQTYEEPTADESPFGMMPGDFAPEEMAPRIEETVPLTEEFAHEETLPADELNLPEEPIAVFPQNVNEGDFYTPDNLAPQSDFLASDLPAGVPETQPFMPGEENYAGESTDIQFASNPLPVPTLLDQVMQGHPGEEEFAESAFQNSVIPDLVIESNSGPIADMREQMKMEDGDSSDFDNGVEIIVMSNPQQNSEDDMIPVIAINGEPIITEERPLPIAEFPAENYATPIAVNQQQRWTPYDNNLPISFPNDDEIPQMFKIFRPQWRENLNFLPSIEQQIQPQYDQRQLPIMEEPQEEVNMYTIAHNMPPEFPTQPEDPREDQIMHIRDNMPFQFPPQSKSLQQESDMYIFGNTMPLFPAQPELRQQTPKINIIRENMSPLFSTLPEFREQTPNMYMKRENMFSQFPIQPEIPPRTPYFMNSRFPPISFGSGDDTFEPNQGRFNEDSDIYQAPDNFQKNYGQASAFQNILKNYDTFKPQPFNYKMFPQDYPRSVSYGKSISRPMQPRMSEPNFNTLERTFMPQNRLMQQNFYPEASARLQRFVQDPFENYESSYTDSEPEESETSYKIRPSNMPLTFNKFNLPQSQYDTEIYPIEMPYTPNYNPFALSSYRNSRPQYPRYQFPSSPNFRTKYLTSYGEPDYFDSDIYSDYDYYSPTALQSTYEPDFYNLRNRPFRGPSPPW